MSLRRVLSFPAVAVAVAVASLALAVPGAVAVGATASPAGVITTIAGGVGGPAAGPRVAANAPCGVTFGGGKLYFTESGGGVVRRLDPGTGMLATVVGPWATGLDVLPGSSPVLSGPCDVAVDAAGNVVFADAGNNVVRVAAARNGTFYGVPMRAGHVYIVAGLGSAEGTPAMRAGLAAPSVAVDRHGNLVVASEQSTVLPHEVVVPEAAYVQVVGGATGKFYGRRMVPGGIYTIAGGPCMRTPSCPPGFGGDGGPATAALFGTRIPQVAVDAWGNVLLPDSDNNRVRVVAESSRVFYGKKMTAGHIYTIAGGGSGGLGDGGPATRAVLSSPQGVAVTADGSVLIADSGNNRVRVVAARSGRFYGQQMTADRIYLIAGNGTAGFSGDKGTAVRAELRDPASVGTGGAGNVLIADSGNNRIRVAAARTGTFYGQKMTAGRIYTIAGNGLPAYSGDGGLAIRAQLSPFFGVARFGLRIGPSFDPGGLAVSNAGNIIVADSANNRVRVVARADGVFYGQRFTAGRIYTIAGTGAPGLRGDGVLATKARVKSPSGVAADAAGNVLVSVSGNGRVRVIAVRSGTFYGKAMTAGHIYTLTRGRPLGLAVDHDGNVVIANYTSLMVVAAKSGQFYGQDMVAGNTYTIDGSDPVAVAVDQAGNLIVADRLDVVKVFAVSTGTFYGMAMTAGNFYTVAGNAVLGFSGDGGPATAAELDSPAAVAVDSAGNLLLADAFNDRVRVVAERTGSFYGVQMTAGDIYTVAGSDQADNVGFSGDGGPATNAALNTPCGIAPLGTGLIVLDDLNNRVRAVSG